MSAPDKTFNCPIWPDCGCPDGTVRPDCPGAEPARGLTEQQYLLLVVLFAVAVCGLGLILLGLSI